MAADSRPIRASRALMAAHLDNRLAHPDKHILRMLIVVPYERTYSAAVAPTGHAGPAARAAEREDSTMKRKHFAIITTILAAVLASGQADARPMSTRAECVAACGNATTETCSWITKLGKFNRCRTKLINQCKRFGTNVMCPAPPPASAPVPPTTLPPPTPPTTTTTVPYVSPTTTTLPAPVNPAAKYAGVWTFYGTLYSNTCAVGTFTIPATVFDTLSVTVYPANPGAASGYEGSGPAFFTGGLLSDGSMGLAAEVVNSSGCIIDYRVALAVPTGGSSTVGGMATSFACPGLVPCTYSYRGVWSR